MPRQEERKPLRYTRPKTAKKDVKLDKQKIFEMMIHPSEKHPILRVYGFQ